MLRLIILSSFLFLIGICSAGEIPPRPRAREAGVQVGVIPPGPQNAITDVACITHKYIMSSARTLIWIQG